MWAVDALPPMFVYVWLPSEFASFFSQQRKIKAPSPQLDAVPPASTPLLIAKLAVAGRAVAVAMAPTVSARHMGIQHA